MSGQIPGNGDERYDHESEAETTMDQDAVVDDTLPHPEGSHPRMGDIDGSQADNTQILHGFMGSTAFWVLGVLIATLITALLIAIVPFLPFYAYLAAWGALQLLLLLWVNSVKHALRESRPTALQLNIPIHNCWIPAKDVDRLRSIFKPNPTTPDQLEEVILVVTRRHKLRLYLTMGFVVFVSVVLFAGSLWAQSKSFQPTDFEGNPRTEQTFSLPWWVPLLVIVLGLIVALIVWLDWKSFILMVTAVQIYRVRIYPILFGWLDTKEKALPVKAVGVSGADRPILSNVFGLRFGTLLLDSAAQQDSEFNRMNWIPEVQIVKSIIDAAKLSLH